MLVVHDDELVQEIERLIATPPHRARALLEDLLERNMREIALFAATHPPLRVAFSVKTNCDPRVLRCAQRHGLYAEVIGPQELALAHETGFGDRTVYNGPFPAWRANRAPGIVFADSIEAFGQNARRLREGLPGVRVRPQGIESRFGVPHEGLHDLARAIAASGRTEIGVSFHVRPEDYAGRTWRDLVASALDFARELERSAGVRVSMFDAGGGKTPQEFDAAIRAGDFAWALGAASSTLEHLEAFVLEPGQEVVTPIGVVLAPVLEVRRNGRNRDVVIDAGYPDLPQIGTFDHRVFAIVDDKPMLLPSGNDRILGCTCLEYDVIRGGVRLPAQLDRLQAIVVADAGAYDWSMSFDFARGGNKHFDDGFETNASELYSSDTRHGNEPRSRTG